VTNNGKIGLTLCNQYVEISRQKKLNKAGLDL
jgi:hypothetical protein